MPASSDQILKSLLGLGGVGFGLAAALQRPPSIRRTLADIESQNQAAAATAAGNISNPAERSRAVADALQAQRRATAPMVTQLRQTRQDQGVQRRRAALTGVSEALSQAGAVATMINPAVGAGIQGASLGARALGGTETPDGMLRSLRPDQGVTTVPPAAQPMPLMGVDEAIPPSAPPNLMSVEDAIPARQPGLMEDPEGTVDRIYRDVTGRDRPPAYTAADLERLRDRRIENLYRRLQGPLPFNERLEVLRQLQRLQGQRLDAQARSVRPLQGGGGL